MTAANFASYSAQIGILILVCAALPRALALRSPALQYLFWRSLLALCLLLPLIEPWRHETMAFVSASPSFTSSAIPGAPVPAVPLASPAFSAAATGIAIVLLCGIAARLASLSIGVLRLRRLRNRASGASTAFADLQRTIGSSATILWSQDVRQPVTFGVLRPVVLLPGGLASADDRAQRAVVAHELHHVKRRDWGWVVGEEIVRSVFWFHPAVWWLISRVQLARETVVDELSILTTNARRAYLDALLAFADDTGLAPMPAFSARRHLFHRVMLLSKEGNMSSSKVALASCVLIGALGAGSWGAVRAFPLSTIAGPAAQDENLPALQGAAAESAPAGLPPQTRDLPRSADQYMPPPPPPPPQAPSLVQPTQDMPESFRNTIDRLHPIRIGGGVKAPTKLKDVQPVYPESAMGSKTQGTVIVEAIIDGSGTVADTRIVRGVPEFNDAALRAVSQWEFTPTLLNGEPTAIICTVTVTFHLK